MESVWSPQLYSLVVTLDNVVGFETNEYPFYTANRLYRPTSCEFTVCTSAVLSRDYVPTSDYVVR